MTSKKKLKKDEIDLVSLIEIIWNYKISILAIICVSITVAFGLNYSKTKETIFKITVPYTILYHSTRAKEVCDQNLDCLHSQTGDEILRELGGGWAQDITKATISTTSKSPSKPEEYNNLFKQINQKITDDIYDTAANDLNEIEKLIKNSSDNYQISFNYADIIKNKRLINYIGNGKKVLFFHNANVTKISKPILPDIIFSIIIGGIIASIYVTINISRKRRKI